MSVVLWTLQTCKITSDLVFCVCFCSDRCVFRRISKQINIKGALYDGTLGEATLQRCHAQLGFSQAYRLFSFYFVCCADMHLAYRRLYTSVKHTDSSASFWFAVLICIWLADTYTHKMQGTDIGNQAIQQAAESSKHRVQQSTTDISKNNNATPAQQQYSVDLGQSTANMAQAAAATQKTPTGAELAEVFEILRPSRPEIHDALQRWLMGERTQNPDFMCFDASESFKMQLLQHRAQHDPTAKWTQDSFCESTAAEELLDGRVQQPQRL